MSIRVSRSPDKDALTAGQLIEQCQRVAVTHCHDVKLSLCAHSVAVQGCYSGLDQSRGVILGSLGVVCALTNPPRHISVGSSHLPKFVPRGGWIMSHVGIVRYAWFNPIRLSILHPPALSATSIVELVLTDVRQPASIICWHLILD